MPIYKEKNKFYFRIYYDNLDGSRTQYKSKRYDTKKECEKAEAVFRLSQQQIKSKITFEEVYDYYLNQYKLKNKYSTYYTFYTTFEKRVLPYFKNKPIEDITKVDIDKYVSEMQKEGRNRASINKYLLYIKSILNEAEMTFNLNCMNTRLIKHLPATEPKKEMLFWEYDEWKNFIKYVSEIEFKALFSSLYYLGLRLGEAQALKWNDYYNKQIHVHGTLNEKVQKEITTPKTLNSYRYVDVPDVIIELLDELRQYYKTNNEYNDEWYIFGGYKPIPRTTIRRHFENYIKESGNKRIRLHDLRHSAVSLLRHLGLDEYQIAERMGHTPQMVREVYAHLFEEKKREAVDKLNQLERKS